MGLLDGITISPSGTKQPSSPQQDNSVADAVSAGSRGLFSRAPGAPALPPPSSPVSLFAPKSKSLLDGLSIEPVKNPNQLKPGGAGILDTLKQFPAAEHETIDSMASYLKHNFIPEQEHYYVKTFQNVVNDLSSIGSAVLNTAVAKPAKALGLTIQPATPTKFGEMKTPTLTDKAAGIASGLLEFEGAGEIAKPLSTAIETLKSPFAKIVAKAVVNAGIPAAVHQVSIPEGQSRTSVFLENLPSDLAFGLTGTIPNHIASAALTAGSQYAISKAKGEDTSTNLVNTGILTAFSLLGAAKGRIELDTAKSRAQEIVDTDLGENPHPDDVAIQDAARQFLASQAGDQQGFFDHAKAVVKGYVDTYNAMTPQEREGGFIRPDLGLGKDEDPLQKNARKLNQLYRQLDREEQSLRAYTNNPESHIKAYGEDRSEKYKTKIENLKTRIDALEADRKFAKGGAKVSPPSDLSKLSYEDLVRERAAVRAEIIDKYQSEGKAGPELTQKYRDLDQEVLSRPEANETDKAVRKPEPAKDTSPASPGEIRTDLKESEAANRERDKISERESKANRQANAVPSKVEQRVRELEVEKSTLEEHLDNHPAKDLMKYVSATTGRLPEATGKESMKSLTGSGKEVRNSIFGRSGDDLARNKYGFEDTTAAQDAVDEYRMGKDRLELVGKDLAEARGKLADERAAAKDEKSLNRVLNKKTTEAEAETAKRDKAAKTAKDLEAKQKELLSQEEYKQTLQEKIDKAKRAGSEERNLLQKTWHTLFPKKGVDPETKQILEEWFIRKAVAKNLGEEEYLKQRTKGPQNFGEILAYEAGKKTPFIKEAFDELGTEAYRRGFGFGWQEDYVSHVYAESGRREKLAIEDFLRTEKKMTDDEIKDYMAGRELPKSKAIGLKLNPNFVKERVFPDYETAMAYGLRPKFKTPAQLLGYYREQLEIASANRDVLEKLKSEAKILPEDDAPTTWEAISRRFSKQQYYAPRELADLINGRFRDEDNLSVFDRSVKALAGVSRFMQEIKLSAGIPFTNVNFFSAGQAIKLITTAVGEGATGKFADAATSLKASFAYIRANSNTASEKWFYENRAYITRMALAGIDLSGRVGGYGHATEELFSRLKEIKPEIRASKGLLEKTKVGAEGAKDAIGIAFDKAFNEKTFGSMMAQVHVQVFKDTYESALADILKDGSVGPEEAEKAAAKFAAQKTKAFGGIVEENGRGKATEDTLSSLFFAPKFREGLINIFYNTLKASTTEFKNEAYSKNRSLIVGGLITYALYNLLNKKLNGKWMWQNPAGHESALRFTLPNGDVAYTEFMPSFLSLPRNLFSGSIAAAKGDFSTASQKFGTAFSMPIKLFTEVMSNSDYFGRPIYKDTDSGKEKLAKIAGYVGLGVNHPFIAETYNYAIGKEPLYQAVSYMLELPVKYGSLDKEQKSAYYAMLDKQIQIHADAKKKVQKTYDKLQEMKAAGDLAGATRIYYKLPKAERVLYDEIKSDEKRAATTKAKPGIEAIYQKNQDLIEIGQIGEATRIYYGLAPADRKLYDSIKKGHDKADAEDNL